MGVLMQSIFTGESQGGFVPAETLVLNGTQYQGFGRNGTAGETLHHPVLGFLVG